MPCGDDKIKKLIEFERNEYKNNTMNREEYRKFQWIASICVAIFIVSFGIVLLAFNRSVYRLSVCDYQENGVVEITKAEAELYYGQIADSFCNFFTGKYRVAGYTLSDTNVHQLNRLKGYYRFAWVLSVLSFGGFCYSFFRLWRRRETKPCYYGSAGGACLAALVMLKIVCSGKPVYRGLENMIWKHDYSYFAGGDLLLKLLPDTFARNLALLYLGIVAAEIGVFVLIRLGIRFVDRPHKF